MTEHLTEPLTEHMKEYRVDLMSEILAEFGNYADWEFVNALPILKDDMRVLFSFAFNRVMAGGDMPPDRYNKLVMDMYRNGFLKAESLIGMTAPDIEGHFARNQPITPRLLKSYYDWALHLGRTRAERRGF